MSLANVKGPSAFHRNANLVRITYDKELITLIPCSTKGLSYFGGSKNFIILNIVSDEERVSAIVSAFASITDE